MIKRVLFARESILFLVLSGLFTAFAIWVPGFFDWFNLFERSRYWVAPGLMAVPMTFIIATAGIDLSVASIMALSAMAMGLLFRDAGLPMPLAACGAMGVGLLAGAFNGGVSSYVRVPPLVVTLATMALFRGAAMGLSRAQPVGGFPEGFLWLGQGDLCQIPGTTENPVFLPVSLVVLLILYLVGWVVLRRSWVGRFTELIGENETAAQFAAINVRFLKFSLYAACGLVCGLASLFHTALYATAKADTGMGMELEVIACVVIGGTRISGGHGSVLGTLLGLFIIGILRFGLEMAGVRSQNVIVVVGLVLIVTAVFNEWVAGRTTGERS